MFLLRTVHVLCSTWCREVNMCRILMPFVSRINFHKYNTGRTIVGKHAWQQEEDQKEDISTVLIFQEYLFTSELFKNTQDVVSLILCYKTM